MGYPLKTRGLVYYIDYQCNNIMKSFANVMIYRDFHILREMTGYPI